MSSSLGFAADGESWRRAGHGVLAAGEALGRAVTTLCWDLSAAGACWGCDTVGRAFFDGTASAPGFGRIRDEALDVLAFMVNVLQVMGDSAATAGSNYAAAEAASTAWSRVADDDPASNVRLRQTASTAPHGTNWSWYSLPSTASGLTEQDPAPGPVMWLFEQFVRAGMSVELPDGSIGGLARVRDAFRAVASAARNASAEVTGYAKTIERGGNEGSAATAFSSYVREVVTTLSSCATSCDAVAETAEETRKSKVAEWYEAGLMAALFLIMFAVALLLSAWLGPIAQVRFWQQVRLGGLSFKLICSALARNVLLKAMLIGALFGAGMTAAGQGAAVLAGEQDGVSFGVIGKGALRGAAAGAIMGAFGLGLKAAAEADLRAAVKLARTMDGTGLAARAARTGYGAVTGFGANLVTNRAFDGKWEVGAAALEGIGMAVIGEAMEPVKASAREALGLPANAGVGGPGDPGRLDDPGDPEITRTPALADGFADLGPDSPIGMARPEDLEGILDLQKRTFVATYVDRGYGASRENLQHFVDGDYTDRWRSRWADPIANGEVAVARGSAGEVTAFVSVTPVSGDVAVFHSLYLDPYSQGHGLGGTLLDRAVRPFDKYTVQLVVTAGTPAVRFYEDRGFRLVAEGVEVPGIQREHGFELYQLAYERPPIASARAHAGPGAGVPAFQNEWVSVRTSGSSVAGITPRIFEDDYLDLKDDDAPRWGSGPVTYDLATVEDVADLVRTQVLATIQGNDGKWDPMPVPYRASESADLRRYALWDMGPRKVKEWTDIIAAAGTVPVARSPAGRVIGFAHPVVEDDGTGGVNAWFVRPGWQGRGIGRGLLGRTLDDLTGREVHLIVVDGSKAKRLYLVAGFTDTGEPSIYVPVHEKWHLRLPRRHLVRAADR